MIKNALKLDSDQFAKTKMIKAKRPSEYWLLFFKKNILVNIPWTFKSYHAFAFIPVVLLVILLSIDLDDKSIILPFMIFSILFSVIAVTIAKKMSNKAFIPVNVYFDLAKFIVSIKGDVYKNLINIKLNSGPIEAPENLLNPSVLGLKNRTSVKYKPYQIERYFVQFTYKDGSSCVVSLNQISVRVTTTKRRSSGKIKSKMKHKHKFFHQLILKLKASDYTIADQVADKTNYDITVKNEGDYNLVKLKFKEKIAEITSEINYNKRKNESIYTSMVKQLLDEKVIFSNTNQKLIN